MVAIAPFRALRYTAERVPDLSAVIAPPYDVIDPKEQEQLYAASPYNVVRLILGKQSAADTATDNRYTRAQHEFNDWRTQQVLQLDSTPAIYLIEQTFIDHGQQHSRLGFIALFQLREAIEQMVYRHEATLSAPKEDRTKLLEAVPANLEPIFCVYPDDGGTVQALLEQQRRRSPDVQARLHGEAVRLWLLSEPAVIQHISTQLASVAVLIADGHHRFEVAYANRARYGMLMSYFVSMADPALVVRPMHRVIGGEHPIDVEALRQLCTLEQVSGLAVLLQWLEKAQGQGRFGYFDGQAYYRVTLKPEPCAQWLKAPSVPQLVAPLDVSLLHWLMLPALGIRQEDVRYTAHADAARDTVQQGQARSAWFLRAIPLEQVYTLAAQGIRLPPKSTYFYPKVPSGLTINPLVDGEMRSDV